MKFKKTNLIISAFVILFVLSSLFLFWSSNRNSNLDFNKNWWSLYFVEAKGDDLDFMIENHADDENFRFEIVDGKTVIESGELTIEKGGTEKIEVNEKDWQNKKITIKVISGEEEKIISKNF